MTCQYCAAEMKLQSSSSRDDCRIERWACGCGTTCRSIHRGWDVLQVDWGRPPPPVQKK